MLRIGPHAGAHRVASRAAISVFVPLAVLVLTGHTAWTVYAAFGAFTSLYGRRSDYADRTGMQAVAALFLILCVIGGTAAAIMQDRAWLVVGLGALVAATGHVVSAVFSWHPPGPLFLVFAFTVCAAIPSQPSQVALSAIVVAASALFAMGAGRLGALREPGHRPAATITRTRVRTVLADRRTHAQVARLLCSTLIAGSIATLLGGRHPYWAMVAAVATLGGAGRSAQVVRGLHRMFGTLVGVLVAWPILALHPRGIVAVLVIVVLQAFAELLVGRNYALALLAITPLALMMGRLSLQQPIGPLLVDRAGETALGAAIALLSLVVVRTRKSSGDPAPASATRG
ncbi:FUSC family protein [Calidifontibacter terrae]